MKDAQTLQLNMILLVLATLRNTTRTSGVAGLRARVTRLQAEADEINTLGEAQTRATEGVTESRDAVLDTMKDAALDLASAVTVHATDAKLPDLLRTVDVNASDFDAMRLAHRPWLATRLVDAAESVLPLLAPAVTAETIADARTKVRAAEAALTAPREAIQSKTSATRRLTTVFKEANETLAQIDRLLFPLRKTEPDFYAGYVSARRILDRPTSGSAEESPSAAAQPTAAPVAASAAPGSTPPPLAA